MIYKRVLLACAASIVTAACAATRSETYGFIATLGDDTTSVERVIRTGDRITSDAVGRSPVVTRRHWEARVGPDGSVKEWTMDTYVPNADSNSNHIHHTARFTDREIRLSRRTSRDTAWAYVRQFPVTVPWNAFVYGTYELLFEAARPRGDSARVGQYFFEGWDEGHVGYADVRRVDSATYSIQSTGLAGTGMAHVGADGRLLSYSGQGTTYKQEVRRLDRAPDIDAIAARFAAEEKRAGVAHSLSVRDTARGRIGSVDLLVDYSRPLRRGRALVGALIPYDQVWRTGANAATQLSVAGRVQIAGVRLDSGTYTLWTLPSRHGVQLVINRQTGQWGTGYRADYDIARVAMAVDSTASNVDRFTIRIDADSAHTADNGRLLMEWGTFRWSVPILLVR
jgi:hypothetical protein